jgi:hypothetical protein
MIHRGCKEAGQLALQLMLSSKILCQIIRKVTFGRQKLQATQIAFLCVSNLDPVSLETSCGTYFFNTESSGSLRAASEHQVNPVCSRLAWAERTTGMSNV